MTNLRLLRTQRGLSQQSLAEKFNLSQQSVYKYENALAEPDITTLKSLADFFGVTIDYLVADTNETPDDELPFLYPEEVQHIRNLRCLPPNIKEQIIQLTETLCSENSSLPQDE